MPQKQFKAYVQEESFVGRYLQYMSRQETAYAYDFWTALWCMSIACGRSVYVNRPRAPVFMNMYAILIGESGEPRKSTSVKTAIDLARRLVRDDPTLALLDSKITPEALDELLKQQSEQYDCAQVAVSVSELAVFLGMEHYIANMPALLTDLYDCPRIRLGGGTLARGTCYQRNVWVSLLSASTPSWLLRAVNPNVIEGGFTSRCYFIVAHHPKQRIAWPEEYGQQTADQDRLLSYMKFIRTEARNHKVIDITEEGKKYFTDWYESREHSKDTFKQTFEAREDAHVLRIAALLSINDNSWLIDAWHIELAILLIADIKEDGSTIFENTEIRTKFARAFDAVRATLITAGMDPVPRGQLYKRMRGIINNEDFLMMMEILHEMGAVQRFEYRTGDKGRPVDYFRGTDMLLAQGFGDALLDKVV